MSRKALSIQVTESIINEAIKVNMADDIDMLNVEYTGVNADGWYCLVINYDESDHAWFFVDPIERGCGTAIQIDHDEVPKMHQQVGQMIIDNNG